MLKLGEPTCDRVIALEVPLPGKPRRRSATPFPVPAMIAGTDPAADLLVLGVYPAKLLYCPLKVYEPELPCGCEKLLRCRYTYPTFRFCLPTDLESPTTTFFDD
jgi:hypothetical protein